MVARARVPSIVWIPFGVVTLMAAAVPLAQSPGPDDHTAYVGGWTLNRELSLQPSSLETPARGGLRGGPPGGPGGFPGSAGGPAGGVGGPPFDPRAMEQMMAVMRELMTPTAHWVITIAEEDGTITFVDAEGHSTRVVPNNKTEKHQLTAGTVETKTKWENGRLRQEISLGAGTKMVRTFAVEPETSQLIVTATMDGGRGGRRAPFRLVYDRDTER